ncbi:MAG: hypothetical protein DMG97_28350 [Acidobacteria bacterium]|nr:MAG: hypothetical protein DMG97_28350 [Acidobacteriota bacterium]
MLVRRNIEVSLANQIQTITKNDRENAALNPVGSRYLRHQLFGNLRQSKSVADSSRKYRIPVCSFYTDECYRGTPGPAGRAVVATRSSSPKLGFALDSRSVSAFSQ